MVTTATWGRRGLLRNERWAKLLIDTLYHYRGKAYLLHEFVIMPDHLHAIITPLTSLEKAAQFIKGGFSYRAKKELGSNLEVWQPGFSDHRVRDASDYRLHTIYVRQNPVRKGLCEAAEQYEYSSASGRYELDDVPQGLKPPQIVATDGAAKAAPFQSHTSRSHTSRSNTSRSNTSRSNTSESNASQSNAGTSSDAVDSTQDGACKIAPGTVRRGDEDSASVGKMAANGRQPTTNSRRPAANDQGPTTDLSCLNVLTSRRS
jgi:putative transposase